MKIKPLPKPIRPLEGEIGELQAVKDKDANLKPKEEPKTRVGATLPYCVVPRGKVTTVVQTERIIICLLDLSVFSAKTKVE